MFPQTNRCISDGPLQVAQSQLGTHLQKDLTGGALLLFGNALEHGVNGPARGFGDGHRRSVGFDADVVFGAEIQQGLGLVDHIRVKLDL